MAQKELTNLNYGGGFSEEDITLHACKSKIVNLESKLMDIASIINDPKEVPSSAIEKIRILLSSNIKFVNIGPDEEGAWRYSS